MRQGHGGRALGALLDRLVVRVAAAAHRQDERSDRVRLEEASPDAAKRLDAVLAKKRFTIAASSPHFLMRCGGTKTGVASSIDALHSILYADDEGKGGLSRTTAALAGEGAQPVGQVVAAAGRKRMAVAVSTRAAMRIRSRARDDPLWHNLQRQRGAGCASNTIVDSLVVD